MSSATGRLTISRKKKTPKSLQKNQQWVVLAALDRLVGESHILGGVDGTRIVNGIGRNRMRWDSVVERAKGW